MTTINSTAKGRLLNIKEAFLLVCRAVGAALFGFAVLSVSYELILRPRHVINVQHEHFLGTNPKALLIGDSRGVHAIRRIDSSFYNYSHFGEYPYRQILRARHALRDKPDIRTIVVQLDDYVVLRQRRYQPLLLTRGFYESLAFASKKDVIEVVNPDRKEFYFNVLAFAYPLSIWWEREDFWGAVRESMTGLGLDNVPPRTRYFNTCGDIVIKVPSLAEKSESERQKMALAAAGTRYRNNKFEASVATLLDDFIKDATARGVTVIGIRFPETAEFRKAAAPLIDPAAEAYIASLPIPILDYRDGMTPDLFTDPEHLTDAGAAILSRRLVADLQPLTRLPAEPLNCTSDTPLRTSSWPYAAIIQGLSRMAVRL